MLQHGDSFIEIVQSSAKFETVMARGDEKAIDTLISKLKDQGVTGKKDRLIKDSDIFTLAIKAKDDIRFYENTFVPSALTVVRSGAKLSVHAF